MKKGTWGGVSTGKRHCKIKRVYQIKASKTLRFTYRLQKQGSKDHSSVDKHAIVHVCCQKKLTTPLNPQSSQITMHVKLKTVRELVLLPLECYSAYESSTCVKQFFKHRNIILGISLYHRVYNCVPFPIFNVNWSLSTGRKQRRYLSTQVKRCRSLINPLCSCLGLGTRNSGES